MTTIEEDCQINSKRKQTLPLKYIFFDFECRQDDQTQCLKGYRPNKLNKCSNCGQSTCGTFAHIPNLCVGHKVCSHCLDKPLSSSSSCDQCGSNELVRGGRVERRSWVNFQCRGVLLVWMIVGQGLIALAVGAGGGCLDIFSLIYLFSFLSPSLWETARYRLKCCLKGPLNPKQPTNQPFLDQKQPLCFVSGCSRKKM